MWFAEPVFSGPRLSYNIVSLFLSGSTSMPYIIDGNNVMGQTPGWHRDKRRARSNLLDQLAGFARNKRVRVTAVFDGAPDDQLPEGVAYHGVKVLYAERGSDADRRIQRLVESAPDPRGIIVVTSDRNLGFLVHSAGAKVVRSGEFRQKFLDGDGGYRATAEPARGRRKETSIPAGLNDRKPSEQPIPRGELEKWMRYFGAAPEDDAADLPDE
jgi:predicted RNA-binding protein with PIN domain